MDYHKKLTELADEADKILKKGSIQSSQLFNKNYVCQDWKIVVFLNCNIL